jgi:hypothetical protein
VHHRRSLSTAVMAKAFAVTPRATGDMRFGKRSFQRMVLVVSIGI